MNKKKAIIIGAGPAGLTAAFELLKHTNIQPIIVEMSNDIGGISKTVNYKGNLMDIGGHRFFSKSDVVMNWWQEIMPIENSSKDVVITYQNKSKTIKSNSKTTTNKDNILLIRNRKSRIYFLDKLFNYPLKLNLSTLKNLGIILSIQIGISYSIALIKPITQEKTLEDFFINRFGKKLYHVFFKDYTEKVWGVKCNQIPAEWGIQRIKGLNILNAIKHYLSKKIKSISQKQIETSLIEKFLYPKFGPGQLWTRVSEIIIQNGGEIYKNNEVQSINYDKGVIKSVETIDPNANLKEFKGDYFISTMPVKNLVDCLGDIVPQKITKISKGLKYRDFITVGLLVNKLELNNGKLIDDNWIYIQEKNVKIGRLQIFNNWSPHLISDPSKVWLGLEYFCNEGDELWNLENHKFITFAIEELSSINIILKKNVIDSTIVRMKKAYPAYFGTYDKFDQLRAYLDKIDNLFLIGRNGMHKYNNQDHSMLTAITAVQNIVNSRTDKSNIWEINTEQEYHEKK